MSLLRYYENERLRSTTGVDSSLVLEVVGRRERLLRYVLVTDDIQGNLQYYYFIRSNNVNRWLVKRIVVDNNVPTIAYANAVNNDTIANINDAIGARATLTYESDVEIE